MESRPPAVPHPPSSRPGSGAVRSRGSGSRPVRSPGGGGSSSGRDSVRTSPEEKLLTQEQMLALKDAALSLEEVPPPEHTSGVSDETDAEERLLAKEQMGVIVFSGTASGEELQRWFLGNDRGGSGSRPATSDSRRSHPHAFPQLSLLHHRLRASGCGRRVENVPTVHQKQTGPGRRPLPRRRAKGRGFWRRSRWTPCKILLPKRGASR